MGDQGTTTRLVSKDKAFSRSISHAYDELHSFRTWLKWMLVDQSTGWTTFFSWFMYILFTIVVPCLSYFGLACSDCDSRHSRPFDKIVQLSLFAIATLSFLCLSRFVSRYGLRMFLFFDRLCDESETVRRGYTEHLNSKDEKYFINNHLTFTVKYHKDVQTDTSRIVGFEVKPFSAKHEYEGQWSEKTRLTTCDPHAKRTIISSESPQEVEDKKEIIFTYDVDYEASDVKWASRWDTYLMMADDQIHWFSIVNFLMIVLFLSGMVAMIMLRTLYRDISKYNQLETQEEAQEETGWKLVHGDVFRPPVNSDLLYVYVGTGVQFFGMILLTMIFAVLGFLSPSNRGGLMTALLMLFVFMGLFVFIIKVLRSGAYKRVLIYSSI